MAYQLPSRLSDRVHVEAKAAPVRPELRRVARRDLADGQLVTLALNGDRRAFHVLMARYDGVLRGMVLRRVRSPEDAADIVQDTLLSAWMALQTYTTHRPFQVWLFHIALNKCRDWGRRRSVRQRSAIYLEDLAPDAVPDAEAALIQTECAHAFRAALGQLPDALRRPLMLTALDGLSQRDAAEQLGVTVKGVETRVRRARLALREAMQ